MKETIESTLKHHRGLKIIQENRDVVLHELNRAKAGWGPSVDVVGKAGGSTLSNTTTRPLGADKSMYGTNSIGLTLTQPLWDGFATRSKVRTAEATVDSMSFRVFDNATTFGLDGLIAHVDVLRRRAILELAKENVRQHQQILSSEKQRVDLGASSAAEVSQTQGRLARALSTLTEAEASLREGEASYIRLTGSALPSSLAPVSLPATVYSDYDSILRTAQQSNPKLKAYIADIKASRGEKELAESAYHPKINLEAGPSYSDRRGPGEQWTSSVDVQLVMRWNIFNSGADKDAAEAATSRMRMSSQVMHNFMDDLTLEIENTWTRYLAAVEQKKYYAEAIAFNTRTRDAYLEQFQLGERSLLDVLDAESELFNSSTQYETVSGNVIVGAYRLHALTGMLLPEMGIDDKALYVSPRQTSDL